MYWVFLGLDFFLKDYSHSSFRIRNGFLCCFLRCCKKMPLLVDTLPKIFASTKTVIEKGIIRRIPIWKDVRGVEYIYSKGKFLPQIMETCSEEVQVPWAWDVASILIERVFLLLALFILFLVLKKVFQKLLFGIFGLPRT